MLYLVTSNVVETAIARGDRQKLLAHLEDVIVSTEALAKLSAGGRLKGGVPLGRRAAVCVIEADSNDELHNLLRGLPYWMSQDMHVTPLLSFEEMAKQDRELLKKLKAG